MNRRTLLVTLAFGSAVLFLNSCRTAQPGGRSTEAEVRAVLETQIAEWNAGHLAGFMETYANSDQTRFASGGVVQRGWQAVFDRYRQRYPDRAAMGRTIFSDLEITMLCPDSALAFGRWRLEREGDQPHGLFTLVLRKRPEGWRILYDHTSAAETK
jgi:ketosteroid isomerase-like protein